MSALETDVKAVIETFQRDKGIPTTEFSPQFVVDMVHAMSISYHKYGRVADAYPAKFDAVADIRTRLAKYRETGDFWFLIDVANFAMIEAMHPRHENGHWGRNDDDTSPGRVDAETRRLQQVNNQGDRLGGDGFLHIKS